MAQAQGLQGTGNQPRATLELRHSQDIASSHERCQAFGLSPGDEPDLTRVNGSALQDLQHRNARLCAQALPVMEMLYEQLTHAQSMVLLTDASGVILHALGDPGFLQRAQHVALSPGALWAEADKGTNAVGTALMTEAPTLVHGQEHFLRAMHFLTCSAAPIFDHKGALLGVIDVSGDRRSYHPHTLALATMSARLIEDQWFADRFRHTTRLHFHTGLAGLGTLKEGQLALDEQGQVLGANRRAMELLGLPGAGLRRENVASLFGQSFGELVDQAAGDGLIQLWHGSKGLQAKLSLSMGQSVALRGLPSELVIRPSPVELPRPVAAAANPSFHNLRQTESQAIQAAVQASGGNLSLAARALGIGRSTLYRKLRAMNG
ncbi:helix-turn-helix domain-containing protein [Pelomonas sp. SE-A7]|uniref:sigma-54-dependent Fis family transcriptional regulator n=1 Tax=Pelomonas sp. SE-A7 TaxID=3054953 RepID=UPI00259C79CE|nr:helix-turn-helix domain-containing protein [Pelomonas sp. SE-A7]MDM4765087.1 helix-turn-helix domain-containing protein [Pelomonas sp. SE-A7]